MSAEENKRICESCKKEFVPTADDLVMLARLDLPPPSECVRCTWRHMLAFWVFGKFRKTESALSGKRIITCFSESARFPIYARDEWISDAWDPLVYGREYDSSIPFFDQLAKLQHRVPHPHQSGVNNTNCEWSYDVWNCKDAYLCRSLLDCEHVTYGYRIVNCKNSIDLVFCFDTELSYDCLYCFKCYKTRHSFDARNCLNSMFLYDCRNLQDCFMCWNLRNKQYHILNQPYTKEAYYEKLKEFDTRSRTGIEKLKAEFAEILKRDAVHRADYNVKTVNVTGNFLEECKNCENCYLLQESENNRHIFRGFQCKDVIFGTSTLAEKSAYSMIDLGMYEVAISSCSANCRYSAYLDHCEECEYCFGCVGLRKKKYCILNRQYTEDEYRTQVKKIKNDMKQREEWGRFFPYEMAYSGYNLSVAQIYFPETKGSVESLGSFWEDVPEVHAEGMNADELSDRIDDVSDDIVKTQLVCPKTGWKFNIAPHELAFYKEHGIPLPQYHFDYRILERLKPLTVSAPFSGPCTYCGKTTTHFYPPEWGYQKIACMPCYQKEIA